MKSRFLSRSLCLAVLLAGLVTAKAQWLTQTVVVTNGWTAAYLFVDASSQNILPSTEYLPISPDNPVDQVWLWKTPASDAQYINNPQSPLNGSGQWLSWSRTNNQNTLSGLIPNAAYLIHSTASSNYYWKIQGKPVAPTYTWDMTGLNLIGFSTVPANPPNFQNFFAQDPAIAGIVQIFEYVGGEFSTNPANPVQVFSQYTTPVNRGQAYWISATNAYNAYFAPFNVNLPTPGGLDYGLSGGQFTLHLMNVTPNQLTVSLALLPSETPPPGQANIVAPPPILLEGALNSSNLTYSYTSIPANGSPSASWTLAPYGQAGSDVAVVLGVNRFAMSGAAGSLYAGILQFTDSLGFSQINVPVAATSANTAGLWLGNASITGVSYDLKTYATNADGSLLISAVTNQIVTTNFVALGATTNLDINNYVTTNQFVYYYQITNQVINTYTQEAYQVATNGYVVTTNWVVSYAALSNLVITTEVTGYYYTNNGSLLVWETANATNGPSLVSAAALTNQMVVTNAIAAVPVNGTPVSVTNWQFVSYAITNAVVTNGIFMSPVTNFIVSDYVVTNAIVGTDIAYDLVGSNLVVTGVTATTNWVFTTNIPAGGVLLLTNSVGGVNVLSGSGAPSLLSGGTYYLGVQNTNSTSVNYGVEVNFHLLGAAPASAVTSRIVSTNGGYLLMWSAPSNDLFSVQWAGSLASGWQSNTGQPYISYNPGYPASGTNAQFTFFDNGAQTGGSLPRIRFYRLALPGVQSFLVNGQPQSNSIAPGATAYFAINVPPSADLASNLLLFASAPVNLLFSSVAPAAFNSGTTANFDQPIATTYAVTNNPSAGLSSATNFFPTAKPLFAATNGASLIFVNVVTNNYLDYNWLYSYYITNSETTRNNYVVIQGSTNLLSSTSNSLAAGSSQISSLATNYYSLLSLNIATNAVYVIATNELVSSVSNYVVTSHNTSLDAVATPYPLRLIVFNDSSGNCSLLQRVYYGIRQETNVVVATTESVLDAAHLNSARRISATHLPWTPTNTVWALSGGPLGQGATLSTTVTEPYDDQAANPFLHTYHPDHDNLDNQSPPHELPVGSESYTITRQITLGVVPNSSDFISLTTANSSLSGNYNETITLTGLGGATKSYLTSGSFSLKRISPISTLTTQ